MRPDARRRRAEALSGRAARLLPPDRDDAVRRLRAAFALHERGLREGFRQLSRAIGEDPGELRPHTDAEKAALRALPPGYPAPDADLVDDADAAAALLGTDYGVAEAAADAEAVGGGWPHWIEQYADERRALDALRDGDSSPFAQIILRRAAWKKSRLRQAESARRTEVRARRAWEQQMKRGEAR